MHLRLLYKKFLCVFMSLMIVIFSTQSAYATTSVGGWTALDTITAGATNTINATKTAGGKVLKSAITIAPQAGKVGKYLLRGGAAGALALAVPQLIGEGIDWVLDPANNAVRYTQPLSGGDTASPYAWTYNDVQLFSTPELAARSTCQLNGFGYVKIMSNGASEYYVTCSKPAGGTRTLGIRRVQNPSYDPTAPTTEEKSIPINTVAAQVISNAESGHAPSQEAVKATALEGFAAGEHDAALDAAATESGTQNPPDTENPPKDGEAVPFDPSSILAALSSISAILAGIMSALTGFVDWWQAQWATFATGITEFFQWVRAEPDTASLQPEPVEVSEGTLVDGWQDKANAGYVNMGNTQCPSDVLIPISYMGASTNLSLSYVPFCHFASIIRYAVILGAWVAALMIISGGRTKE